MDIAITGSSGLIGSAVVDSLVAAGHRVRCLVRTKGELSSNQVYWNPDQGILDARYLEGVEAIVHLAGENIAARRWSPTQKERILQSRVRGTTLLARTLAEMSRPPRVLVSASAIGFYGDRGETPLTESSAPGQGFLAEVCREWEASTRPAADAGVRVVCLRLGVVLSSRGGALAKMLTPFRLGLGGRIGHGRQWMSWIALDDVVGVIHHALNDTMVRGPVNAVAPNPVTNREFTRALGQALRRPTVLPMPAFAARLVFGEMADELLLTSARVQPAVLASREFKFQFNDIDDALAHVLSESHTANRQRSVGSVEPIELARTQ